MRTSRSGVVLTGRPQWVLNLTEGQELMECFGDPPLAYHFCLAPIPTNSGGGSGLSRPGVRTPSVVHTNFCPHLAFTAMLFVVSSSALFGARTASNPHQLDRKSLKEKQENPFHLFLEKRHFKMKYCK